jgi:hypothetical protein
MRSQIGGFRFAMRPRHPFVMVGMRQIAHVTAGLRRSLALQAFVEAL